MTIEEAIKHCKEVAAGKTVQGNCPECAAEHEQLAEWLEELARYRTQAVAEQNTPLTLEELQKMDGEPVWLGGNGLNRWGIFSGVDIGDVACFVRAALPIRQYGVTWFAYRGKPEEAPADG